MTQFEISIWNFTTNVKNGFRGLLSSDYKVRKQHKKFEDALDGVESALNNLRDAWNSEVIIIQEKAIEKYRGKVHTVEEVMPLLRADFPLLFTSFFLKKHWYSKHIAISIGPSSDKSAYRMLSAWVHNLF